MKNPGPVRVGQVRTQRELILEAVEALETLLGQGVGEQLEVLLQSPTHPPASPTELERAQQPTPLLGQRNRIETKNKKKQDGTTLDKAKATLAKAETGEHQGLEELSTRLTHVTRRMMLDGRDDRATGEGWPRTKLWRVFWWKRLTVRRRSESRVRLERSGKLGRVGSAAVRGRLGGIDVNRLLEILHGLSEEDQDLSKRNMEKHGGSDVSSMEDGVTEVPARVEDPAETPCS